MAAYILKSDLAIWWDANLLDQSLDLTVTSTIEEIEAADLLIERLSNSKEIEVKGLLLTRYKIDLEFAKTGGERNAMLVEYLSKLIILELEERKSMGMPSEHRLEKRKDIFILLKRFTKGFEDPVIPEVVGMADPEYIGHSTFFVEWKNISSY